MFLIVATYFKIVKSMSVFNRRHLNLYFVDYVTRILITQYTIHKITAIISDQNLKMIQRSSREINLYENQQDK